MNTRDLELRHAYNQGRIDVLRELAYSMADDRANTNRPGGGGASRSKQDRHKPSS